MSVSQYATDFFQKKIVDVMKSARELTKHCVHSRWCIFLVTEEMGQDIALDVSHLVEVFARPEGDDTYYEAWKDRPIFFEHAVAASEAIARGIDCVYWQTDWTDAWR